MTAPARTTSPHAPMHLLIAAVIGALVAIVYALAEPTLATYGGPATLNAGWVFTAGKLTVGYETVGDPGVFAQVPTPVGMINYFDEELSFCPIGANDIQCGA